MFIEYLGGKELMKYLKYSFIVCILAIAISAISTYAMDGYASVVGVTLPKFGGETDATSAYKTELGRQYYKSFGTIDMLTSAKVNIKVRTRNDSKVLSSWLTLGENESKYWDEGQNYNTGSYTLVARRENAAISEAKHSGAWYLNKNLYDRVN